MGPRTHNIKRTQKYCETCGSSGSCSSEYEFYPLLGCDTMQLVKRRYDPEEFLACMFKKEGGGSRFL
jgi:hypothetical protein